MAACHVAPEVLDPLGTTLGAEQSAEIYSPGRSQRDPFPGKIFFVLPKPKKKSTIKCTCLGVKKSKTCQTYVEPSWTKELATRLEGYWEGSFCGRLELRDEALAKTEEYPDRPTAVFDISP